MAFMGMITFLPLYLQLGHGTQATISGMTLTPLMIGLIISSTVCGRLVTRTGKYKPFMLFGSATIVIAAITLVTAGPHAGPLDMTWRIFVLGLGLGPSQSLLQYRRAERLAALGSGRGHGRQPVLPADGLHHRRGRVRRGDDPRPGDARPPSCPTRRAAPSTP